MRPVKFLLLVLVAFLLSSTLLSFMPAWGVKPNLFLTLVILNGFYSGPREGALWGMAGGLLQDLLGGGYLGLYALEGLAAGYLAAVAGNKFYRDNTGVLVVSTFAVSYAAGAVPYLLFLFLSIHVSVSVAFLRLIPITSAYNAIVAPFGARLFSNRSQGAGMGRTRF